MMMKKLSVVIVAFDGTSKQYAITTLTVLCSFQATLYVQHNETTTTFFLFLVELNGNFSFHTVILLLLCYCTLLLLL